MQLFLGLVSIQALVLFVMYLGIKYPKMAFVLIIALLVRLLLSLINIYVFPLPDSQYDAWHFEEQAAILALGGFESVSHLSFMPGSDFYRNLIAFIYLVLDRSKLLIQSINIAVSLLIFINVWALYKEVWGPKCSNKLFYFMAVFPSFALYSVVTLREIYITFFLSLIMLNIIRWYKYKSLKYYYIGLLACVIGMFFHGSIGIYLIVLFFLMALNIFKDRSMTSKRFIFSSLTLLALLYFSYIENIVIPKIGYFNDLLNLPDIIIHSMSQKAVGRLGYPDWIIPQNKIDLVWSIPAYTFMFLCAPFLWDTPTLIGIFSAIDVYLYLFLFVLIWKKRSQIRSNDLSKVILFFLIITIIFFGLGTGNSATALRHRVNLLPMLFALIPMSESVKVFRFKLSARQKI